MFGRKDGEGSWRTKLRGLLGRFRGSEAMPREELEQVFFEADLSAPIVNRLLGVADRSKGKSREDLLKSLQETLAASVSGLSGPEVGLPIPGAILLLGVNGAGKTTFAAKLAKRFKDQNIPVILAAGDTFRAGAIDQLKEWARRLEIECVGSQAGGDPGAVIFDAWQSAIAKGAVLIADTAGRLHTKAPLVDELRKIVRVLAKDGKGAPHRTYLVLDGTTGQNALAQSREFLKAVPVTGLVVTKLDGTARGGAALSASLETSIPIRYVGIGEKLDDLREFESDWYSKELLSL